MKIQRCTQLSGRLILVGSVALVVIAAVTVSTSATAQSDALQATETSTAVIENFIRQSPALLNRESHPGRRRR